MLAEFAREPSIETASLSVLLKGVSGSGKTRTSLSFPGPILSLYADVNRETVREAFKAGTDVKVIPIASWSQYEATIVPAISARKLGLEREPGVTWEPRTIVVDTVSFLSDMLLKEIQGSRDALQQADWGKVLRRMLNTTRELVYSTTPTGGHPGYHIIFCTHLRDVTDDKENLVKICPALPGQFKDRIENCFDYVLLCESEVVGKAVSGKVERTRQFRILGAPPDRYHTCKGGALPPVMEIAEGQSAFAVMNKHWQLK